MSNNVFFIADLHLGHRNIINYSRQQFDSIEEHNEAIVDNWNSVVKKKDTVWVLGDVAFGVDNLHYLGRMSGNKKLVLGNHDAYQSPHYAKYFRPKLYGCAYFDRGILTHIPIHPQQLEHRFQFNIHGHLHNGDKIDDSRYYNVCADSIDLTPIEWSEIKQYINKTLN